MKRISENNKIIRTLFALVLKFKVRSYSANFSQLLTKNQPISHLRKELAALRQTDHTEEVVNFNEMMLPDLP